MNVSGGELFLCGMFIQGTWLSCFAKLNFSMLFVFVIMLYLNMFNDLGYQLCNLKVCVYFDCFVE